VVRMVRGDIWKTPLASNIKQGKEGQGQLHAREEKKMEEEGLE